MHANFSNSTLKECGSQEIYEKICEAFRSVTKEHIDVYGAFNEQRLTGLHETARLQTLAMEFQIEEHQSNSDYYC